MEEVKDRGTEGEKDGYTREEKAGQREVWMDKGMERKDDGPEVLMDGSADGQKEDRRDERREGPAKQKRIVS